MVKLLVAMAIGYVLGAKAGRERYEEIVRCYHQVLDHPTVKATVGKVRGKIDEARGSQPDATA